MSDLEKRLHYITKLERNEEGTIVDDRVCNFVVKR